MRDSARDSVRDSWRTQGRTQELRALRPLMLENSGGNSGGTSPRGTPASHGTTVLPPVLHAVLADVGTPALLTFVALPPVLADDASSALLALAVPCSARLTLVTLLDGQLFYLID